MKQEELSRIECFRQFRNQIRGSDKYLIVGIDVAKSKHHATFATTKGRIGHKGQVFENNASGFEHLLTQVQFYTDPQQSGGPVFSGAGRALASMRGGKPGHCSLVSKPGKNKSVAV